MQLLYVRRMGRQGFVADRSCVRMAPVVSVAQPSLSRRHAAGTATARGLLFTVLGEFVLPGGGRTLGRLTPAAERLLVDGTARIYAFPAAGEWDGRWLIVLARTPEAE